MLQYTMHESDRRGRDTRRYSCSGWIEAWALFVVQIFAMGMIKLAAEWAHQMDDSVTSVGLV